MPKEKRKRPEVPPPSGEFGLLRQAIEQVRLAFALLLDGRVPVRYKILPILAFAYALSPIDLMPDVLVGIGWLDDFGIVVLALGLLIYWSPASIVAEHLHRLRFGTGMRVRRDSEGLIIDVEAKPGRDSEAQNEEQPTENVVDEDIATESEEEPEADPVRKARQSHQ
jgi:uncharacterized membrane protein YkvA (DUF1232 family)